MFSAQLSLICISGEASPFVHSGKFSSLYLCSACLCPATFEWHTKDWSSYFSLALDSKRLCNLEPQGFYCLVTARLLLKRLHKVICFINLKRVVFL